MKKTMYIFCSGFFYRINNNLLLNLSKIYKTSGYGFFKNNHYGIVTFAGPKGTHGSGGHWHNDKCSFVLE